jgi:NADPH-dependent curcumin reductase CurA
VVVAAASGAVGSVVGQIARIKGARAVGIAGSEEKCKYVKEELGFDACVNHNSPEFAEALRRVCSEGIDVYFENVGGKVFETVSPLLNDFARIPVCGVIQHITQPNYPWSKPDSFADARHPRQATYFSRLHRLGLCYSGKEALTELSQLDQGRKTSLP